VNVVVGSAGRRIKDSGNYGGNKGMLFHLNVFYLKPNYGS